MEIYQVNFRIKSECEEIRTRKTPNLDTFQAVYKNLISCIKSAKSMVFTDRCSPYTGEYESVKIRILAYFMQ